MVRAIVMSDVVWVRHGWGGAALNASSSETPVAPKKMIVSMRVAAT